MIHTAIVYIVQYNILYICSRNVFTNFPSCSYAIDLNNEACLVPCAVPLTCATCFMYTCFSLIKQDTSTFVFHYLGNTPGRGLFEIPVPDVIHHWMWLIIEIVYHFAPARRLWMVFDGYVLPSSCLVSATKQAIHLFLSTGLATSRRFSGYWSSELLL